MSAGVELELRCPTPVGPDAQGKLLGKTYLEDPVPGGGMVELGCWNCARTQRAAGHPVVRVLHRFTLLGTLVETIHIESGA